MTLRLSKHLKLRIKIRKINKNLPGKIVEHSESIYFDILTRHWVAVKKEKYAGKLRPIVAIFDKVDADTVIITVYPSDENEINSRVKKGRWTYEKENN